MARCPQARVSQVVSSMDIVLYDFGVGLYALYLHVSCMCSESKHIAFDACTFYRPIIILQIIMPQYTIHNTQYTYLILLFRKNDGVLLHLVGAILSSLFFIIGGVLDCPALYSSVGFSPFRYVRVHSAIILFGFLLSQQVMVLGDARILQTARSVSNSALI